MKGCLYKFCWLKRIHVPRVWLNCDMLLGNPWVRHNSKQHIRHAYIVLQACLYSAKGMPMSCFAQAQRYRGSVTITCLGRIIIWWLFCLCDSYTWMQLWFIIFTIMKCLFWHSCCVAQSSSHLCLVSPGSSLHLQMLLNCIKIRMSHNSSTSSTEFCNWKIIMLQHFSWWKW